MRPLEALLFLASLLALLALLVPLPGTVLWIRHLAPLALLVAAGQALVEGARWQMVPAYTLAVLFFLSPR